MIPFLTHLSIVSVQHFKKFPENSLPGIAKIIFFICKYFNSKLELINCFNKIIKKGSFVLTEEVSDFEKNVQNYTNNKYCLGLNSGTDALMMALWALGIKKGDEVITSPISFVASAGAIAHVGAIPVFVDVDHDLNINVNLIERSITKKTITWI